MCNLNISFSLGKTGTLVETCLVLDTPAGKESSTLLLPYFTFCLAHHHWFSLSWQAAALTLTNHFKTRWYRRATRAVTAVFHTDIFASTQKSILASKCMRSSVPIPWNIKIHNLDAQIHQSFPSRSSRIRIEAFQVLRPLSVAEHWDKVKLISFLGP